MEDREEMGRDGGGRRFLFLFFFSGLAVGAVLVRRPGAGRQVVEGGGGLVLIAVAARRHPLVDAVQPSSLLEALDLVLWVEALNGCESKTDPSEAPGQVIVIIIIHASQHPNSYE